jgi:LysM repeat protein
MGQTAWAIAVRYGVDLETLLTLNHLPDNPVLRPGDRLTIQLAEGQSVPPLSQLQTHTVQAGESAWSIAARYNLTLDDLRALNDLPENPVLQPGDELIIRQPPPTPTATGTLVPTLPPPSATNLPTGMPIPTSTTVALAPSPTSLPSPTLTPMPTATMILEMIDPPEERSGLVTIVLLGVGFLLVAGMIGGAVTLYIWRKSQIQVH